VRGCFENGGQRLFVARVVRPGATAASISLATERGAQRLELDAIGPGAWGNTLFTRVGATGRQLASSDSP
jgi:hypothetical protein